MSASLISGRPARPNVKTWGCPSRANRGPAAATVDSASGAGVTITPLRPTKFSLWLGKAQPRGSFESTKTGMPGPKASAIFPASDHLVEMMKPGGWSKTGALVRPRQSKLSSRGSAERERDARADHGQPVEASTTATPAIAARSADDRKAHRRSAPTERPNSSTHAPSKGNAKNQPGIVQ